MFRLLMIEGVIDHRHYKIKISLDYRLPTDMALRYLENTWNVINFEIGNADHGDDEIIRAILKLESQEEIEQLGSQISIFGFKCNISHQ